MGELMKIVNIGKELEKRLNMIGIYNYDDLVSWGSTEAWLKIKEVDSTVCINCLLALEGAIQGIRWHDLKDSDKKYLKEFYLINK